MIFSTQQEYNNAAYEELIESEKIYRKLGATDTILKNGYQKAINEARTQQNALPSNQSCPPEHTAQIIAMITRLKELN